MAGLERTPGGASDGPPPALLTASRRGKCALPTAAVAAARAHVGALDEMSRFRCDAGDLPAWDSLGAPAEKGGSPTAAGFLEQRGPAPGAEPARVPRERWTAPAAPCFELEVPLAALLEIEEHDNQHPASPLSDGGVPQLRSRKSASHRLLRAQRTGADCDSEGSDEDAARSHVRLRQPPSESPGRRPRSTHAHEIVARSGAGRSAVAAAHEALHCPADGVAGGGDEAQVKAEQVSAEAAATPHPPSPEASSKKHKFRTWSAGGPRASRNRAAFRSETGSSGLRLDIDTTNVAAAVVSPILPTSPTSPCPADRGPLPCSRRLTALGWAVPPSEDAADLAG
mmetsp:Transcript_126708/g.354733  ORF Transcript_126708/g.354733 Transcript_126708/m.354733 type:complete len:340 (-) Transcript_126708:91-1110(-)